MPIPEETETQGCVKASSGASCAHPPSSSSHFCLGLSVPTRGDRCPKAGRTRCSRLRTAPALGLPTRRPSLVQEKFSPCAATSPAESSPGPAWGLAPSGTRDRPAPVLAGFLHPPPNSTPHPVSCLLEPGPPGSAVVSPQLAGCIPPPRPGRHGNRPVNPHPLHCPSNSFATRCQWTLQEYPPFRGNPQNRVCPVPVRMPCARAPKPGAT